jgi:hypothetical protein
MIWAGGVLGVRVCGSWDVGRWGIGDGDVPGFGLVMCRYGWARDTRRDL